MNRHSLLSLLSLFTIVLGFGSPTAEAALAQAVPSEKKIESVTLSKSVIFQFDGKDVAAVPVASGLRRKKVAVFWAKVYAAEIFTTSPEGIDRSSGQALVDSLLAKNLVGLRLAFVRDVTAQQTIDGLKDGLKANGFDPDAAELKPLFEAIVHAGPNQDGKSLWVVGTRSNSGEEKAYIEGTKKELLTVALEKGSLRKLLLIWFGNPADSGLEKMKADLLKAP